MLILNVEYILQSQSFNRCEDFCFRLQTPKLNSLKNGTALFAGSATFCNSAATLYCTYCTLPPGTLLYSKTWYFTVFSHVIMCNFPGSSGRRRVGREDGCILESSGGQGVQTG